MSNIWFGWILIVGLIVISGVSATPGDSCTTHSHCEAGEYCYNAGACSQCFNNNVCAIYGNSIDGDCSKCSTSSSPTSSSNLCSTSSPCSDDSFCNFDEGNSGFCESCSTFKDSNTTIALACGSDNLPASGVSDCKTKCSHASSGVSADSTPNYYCVTACMISVNDNNCGDNNGQTHECVSYVKSAISNPENVASSFPTNVPAGFLGCTSSACNTLCANSGVTDASPIAFMSASNTWCLVKDKTMWMNADQANMAAISRGCSGSHEMNGMYMHGNTHMACQSTYTAGGLSSGTILTGLFALISASVVAFVLV